MAAFSINADKARALLPGNEVHPLRVWNKGLLIVTVVNYVITNIGKYIEFSIAIACTHGSRPAPRLLPALFSKTFGAGQYVYDLPVSTEISVKGGKGILSGGTLVWLLDRCHLALTDSAHRLFWTT